jgi:hypothetical protein
MQGTCIVSPNRFHAILRSHLSGVLLPVVSRLRHFKDVTLGEDRSLIHQANGQSIMAILRDTVVSMLHRAGEGTITARLRYSCGHPKDVFTLLGIPIADHA